MIKEAGHEIGFVGLGRMGLNMATNLVEKGYRVVGFDPNTQAQESAKNVGVEIIENYASMISALSAPRVVWLMIPSSLVDRALEEITPLLDKGDTIIDGGNSFYKDSLVRHATLKDKGIHFLDCGTSGGMDGARHGASLMVGGSQEAYALHQHIFKSLAAENGYALVGKEGAGHFVKMIHNGIEYGMMGAIAEGVAILHDNETQFGINLKDVFKPYEHESIITSKLVTWLRQAYDEGQIDMIAGVVPRGETEEEMEHITTLGQTLVLEAALTQRKQTRDKESYLGKLVAAMRNQFGGHKVVQNK
jgi:6-phosphogluconate dehydrogenase